ncbi:MAG: hypothetical protein HOJ88_07295 [Proteobacteria bacterium]|nr:hypothetical protein [Pseudomonadota bacterium]
MKCKIYLSDMGFGHLVRQRAIYEQLTQLCPALIATVQTGSHAAIARNMFGSAAVIEKFNNIEWARQENGSPDLKVISEFFDDYASRSTEFVDGEDIADFDFVISDFVYEAFPAAKSASVPCFGVAHFTWDWFFSKMYPPPVSYQVLQQMQRYAHLADAVFFPPFTPEEILRFYGGKAVQVPLIVGNPNAASIAIPKGKFTVLIMDSGASILSQHIDKAVDQLSQINSMHFLVAEKHAINSSNVTVIPKTDFFSDYIPQVDLVVTRGGFNTISECIAYRTPLLLLGEASNPEIEQNLLAIKSEQLGSFTSLDRFSNHLRDTLESFVAHEYTQIKKRMNEHNYTTNGAQVIAEHMLNKVRC